MSLLSVRAAAKWAYRLNRTRGLIRLKKMRECEKEVIRQTGLVARFSTEPSTSTSYPEKQLTSQENTTSEQRSENEAASNSHEVTSSVEGGTDILNSFAETDTFREDIYAELNPAQLDMLDSLATDVDDNELDDYQKEQKIRDVSGMKLWHKMIVHGQVPPMGVFYWQTKRYALRERYAKYGKASGVNPGVMWPTAEELKERDQIERQWSPQFHEVLSQVQQEKADKEARIQERIAEVERNVEKYPKILAEFEAERQAKESEQTEQQRRIDEKIREIQEYFGYAVEPGDPRFQAMMERKEEEEKRALREARKKERQAKLIAQLQETVEAVQAADKGSSPNTSEDKN